MASPTKRRPLPALILLVALTLLTTLVWYRVLHRSEGKPGAAKSCQPQAVSQSVLPRPAGVAVSVWNSTSRRFLAKTTAATLTKVGFKDVAYQNDLPKVHVAGVAEIRFGPAGKKDAALLAYYFPGAKLVALKTTPRGPVVVSLGAKFKAVATARAVRTAMKAAHVTLAPTNAPTSPPSGTGSASCAVA